MKGKVKYFTNNTTWSIEMDQAKWTARRIDAHGNPVGTAISGFNFELLTTRLDQVTEANE